MWSILSTGLLLAIARPVLSLTFASDTIEATFDDLRAHKYAFETLEVQQYAGLQWDGFSVDMPRPKHVEGFRGVEVKSSPNYIGGRVDMFGGLPTITANYTRSEVAFFDLNKLWWGCSTTDQFTGEPGPGWCTLEINGYSHGVKEPTAKATSFFFPSPDAKSMEMVESPLPSSFRALARVEFNVIATNPTLFLDNVSYTIYNVTSMGAGLGEVIHSQETSNGKFQSKSGGDEEIPIGFTPKISRAMSQRRSFEGFF